MILQPIVNIAEICSRQGVDHFILCPGSRSAPLTLAFARHPRLKTYQVSDERSAAFIGLGIARQLGRPVGLVCTSGTALLNFAPAIAEAFYQGVPLVVFSADRPPEWVDQWDGQTIRQFGIYGNHIKKSFQLPVDLDHLDAVWQVTRTVSEAINLSNRDLKGPVHVNCPFREPFYPASGEKMEYDVDVQVISEEQQTSSLSEDSLELLREEWEKHTSKLIIGGQHHLDKETNQLIGTLSASQKIPVIGDIISNLSGVDELIIHQDLFLGKEKPENLRPDLLLTFGKSAISKNLKLFLRKYKAKVHWHLQVGGDLADPYQSLTRVIPATPHYLFDQIKKWASSQPAQQEKYWESWISLNNKCRTVIPGFWDSQPFGEFEALARALENLPKEGYLHLANSMPVRYANFLGLPNKCSSVEVRANRGTSGIDGCVGSALGNALTTEKTVTLIAGDMAFLYDRNSFWHNSIPPNLRVIVLNNHGGGIFRLIDGPSQLPELEEFFETRQTLKVENTAQDFGLDYLYCNNRDQLFSQLSVFYQDNGKARVLEVETEPAINQQVFKEFKSLI